MFNLSESWKKNYEEFLNEEYENFDSSFAETFAELEEAQKTAEKSFDIVNEYFSIFALSESQLNEEDEIDVKKEKETDEVIEKNLKDMIKDLANDKSDVKASLPKDYKAVAIPTVERFGDMKFPQNIIFFVKQLINWIKHLVVYFIEKIKNLFRVLIGSKPKELNKDYIKFSLDRERELETMQLINTSGEPSKVIKAYRVDPSKVSFYQKPLTEAPELFKEPEVRPDKQPIVITMDLSKDLLALRQLVSHFYDLFDNAYGSNNEQLFGTEDLEIILKIFRNSIKSIKTGDLPTYEVGGTMAEVSAIDSSRIKENLIRTHTNVQALQGAYQDTANRINDIAKIINNKELLMTKDMGISFAWLTGSTLKEMNEIQATIKPRLKEAEKLMKALDKAQRAYGEVANELQKMQHAILAISNITYTSVYQRRVQDLLLAAKYMTQLVSLRLSALGVYIKELKDIRNIISMLAVLNDKR